MKISERHYHLPAETPFWDDALCNVALDWKRAEWLGQESCGNTVQLEASNYQCTPGVSTGSSPVQHFFNDLDNEGRMKPP